MATTETTTTADRTPHRTPRSGAEGHGGGRPRSGARWFYALAAVAGAVIPWIFFGSFLATEGPDPIGFVRALFPNGAAGGFSADVLVSATVFWVWSYRDSRLNGVARWWLVLPATLLVGLSLAFPLYLYRRELAV